MDKMKSMEQIVGKQFTLTSTVIRETTADFVGSGSLPVLATPMLIALMEADSASAIGAELPSGSTSVGTEVCIKHTRATGLGKAVSVTATVIAVDRRRVDFAVIAHDDKGEIGAGTHSRFVVDVASFMEKVEAVEE